MTTIDDAKIIQGILNTNWNTGNVAKPTFYFDDSIKNHDYRQDAIKIYIRSGPLKTPIGAYDNYTVSTGISIDIRCSNRDRMLALRDEVNRIIESIRKTKPDTNYTILLPNNERQVTGYANFWHYVIEVTLSGLRTIS